MGPLYQKLLLLLGFLVLSFLIMEGWFYYIKPSHLETDRIELIRNNLETAKRMFEKKEKELVERSAEITEQVQDNLLRRADKQDLYQIIKDRGHFWGITLFKNDTAHVWDGFAYSTNPVNQNLTENSRLIKVQKQNNVILLLCNNSFSIPDSAGPVRYDLVTTSRIEQKNALPIGKNRETSFIDESNVQLDYPVSYSFFTPVNPLPEFYKSLKISTSDSVGLVYAEPGQFDSMRENWKSSSDFWKSVFFVVAFILLSSFLYLYLWNEKTEPFKIMVYQLVIILIVWVTIVWLDLHKYIFYQINEVQLQPGESEGYIRISSLAVHSIFILLISLTLYHNLSRMKLGNIKVNWLPATLFISICYGLAGIAVILPVIYLAHELIVMATVPLMDLQILPDKAILLLYLTLGLFLFSTGFGLFSMGDFLVVVQEQRARLIFILSAISFILGTLFLQPYLIWPLTTIWAILLSILFFLMVLAAIQLTLRSRDSGNFLSPLRVIALISISVSLAAIPLFYYGHLSRLDRNLQSNTEEFLVDEDPFARQITGRILTTLEQQLRGITPEDMENQLPGIQSRFTQTIEQTITAEWQTYSLDLQLINLEGKLLADYSTDLNSPNWVNVFDLPRLATAREIERITKSTNRPIIQLPQLENAEDYETFYRGWISIFSPDSEEPIAWILCSVYKERPNFEKPMRAVLASLTYEDWKDSYMLLHYQNKNLVHHLKRGVTGRFPKYSRLRDPEVEALEQADKVYYTDNSADKSYRVLLSKMPSGDIIKAMTIIPDLKTVLFSFFRFSFVILLAGLVIVAIRFISNPKKYPFWGDTKRFEYRILDSFLLVSLIFLGFLVATTHYTITIQNEEIVKQELFDKLEGLTTTTEQNERFRRSIDANTAFSLDSLASPLDADAAFYDDLQVTESTTPQIYQQHLVANILPFHVYDDLYLEQRRESISTVRLASQDLLIGFRSVLAPNSSPVAVISIPTFIYSPKYNQQLLETISYLIVLYLLIFGLFILGTTYISKRLTRPLRYIQQGLNKITKGNMDTRIPVRSNDEIGDIAKAYNEMVSRLKELQKELALAEREAAWQEMAQQVAHEIKNPLTPMKLNVQHLERQLEGNNQDKEQLKETIKKITGNLIEQIKTLNTIASEFSKFSKPISEEFTRVEVDEVISSVVDLYKHDNKVKIYHKQNNRPLYVKGISDELKRVFINIVKNSFEAIPEDGMIEIKSYEKDNSIFVEIADNGTGISEEDKSKIFVPNFSTKSSGTGLGLAISKKIIEAHNGSISFASIEDKGTTFIIKLPSFYSFT